MKTELTQNSYSKTQKYKIEDSRQLSEVDHK